MNKMTSYYLPLIENNVAKYHFHDVAAIKITQCYVVK